MALDKAVAIHSGRELRVYSQEMLLALLLTGHDPYGLGAAEVAAVFGDHPALQHLASQLQFNWPTLLVPESLAEPPDMQLNLRDSGVLGLFGYTVGLDAGAPSARRRALQRCLENCVPARANPDLKKRIVLEGTAPRLQQVAEAIASQYRLASRRRGADMSRAMKHWHTDLEWLRKRFYEPMRRPKFVWPAVHVD